MCSVQNCCMDYINRRVAGNPGPSKVIHYTGADPEFGKRGGTLLKKLKSKKKGHNNNS